MSKMSLSVDPRYAKPTTIAPIVIEHDADEDDRVWLEKCVNTFAAGMKAAQAAALEIARNWTKGRAVGRLYPDYPDAISFLQDYVGTIRLPREERDRFIVALVGSGISRRSAAKLTGVSHETAAVSVRNLTRKPRKPRQEPTETERLVKAIDGILGARATLPDELDRWLIGAISEEERVAVWVALDRLIERVAEIKRSLG